MHGFAVWCLAFAFVGTRWGQKKELLGVSHAYGNKGSPLWEGAVWATFPDGGSGSDLLDPKRQPKRKCLAGICPEVRSALLGLS